MKPFSLPAGWEIKLFGQCIKKVKYTEKQPTKSFLPEGKFPIVSQEKELISGYSNNQNAVFSVKNPVVIFGDHTKVVKYIDFDFVIGADGVKILQPIEDINAKYFYYYLSHLHLRDLGYARHYKLLKECIVIYPPLPEQKRIVEKLDKIFAAIDKAKSQTEKNFQNAKDIFKSYFNQLFTPQNTKHWVEQELNRLFYITAGGDKPPIYSKYMTDKCSVPIYSNAVENQGLYGYTNEAAIHLPALTISARGTIGFVCKRESPYFPIVRLLSLVPKNNENNLNFLFYAVQKVVQKSTGSSIPQLTIPMIAKEKIRYPERLEEQRHIVFSLEQFKSLTDKISLICNQKLADLEELKQAVLQQAFSGKL